MFSCFQFCQLWQYRINQMELYVCWPCHDILVSFSYWSRNLHLLGFPLFLNHYRLTGVLLSFVRTNLCLWSKPRTLSDYWMLGNRIWKLVLFVRFCQESEASSSLRTLLGFLLRYSRLSMLVWDSSYLWWCFLGSSYVPLTFYKRSCINEIG